MSWTIGNGEIKATAEYEGETKEYTFPKETLLRKAVQEIADNLGLSSVSVFDTDGEELLQDEGGKPLSEVGEIKVVKKMQAA